MHGIVEREQKLRAMELELIKDQWSEIDLMLAELEAETRNRRNTVHLMGALRSLERLHIRRHSLPTHIINKPQLQITKNKRRIRGLALHMMDGDIESLVETLGHLKIRETGIRIRTISKIQSMDNLQTTPERSPLPIRLQKQLSVPC
eukprot:TRINITY_DN1976_c0_g1_i1.p1 TRINITY_DN1976_c0_g1~~TRINITY_DN1976_c0_g1_i1.p1  ORF type:complete len:147 (+),score=28.09 TRINITY_DN1976_c0_g1_i1:102-542(+)